MTTSVYRYSGGEEGPVERAEPRTPDLPAQDPDLVPKYGHLDLGGLPAVG